MPRPRLPSWSTLLTTLAVLITHALVLWILADLLFNLHPDESITPGPYLISALVLSTLLLPILILALRGRRPRGLRHCPRCWYTLDPALGLKCPECSHEAKSDRHTRKPRRRWKLAAATLCLITLCQLTWLETRIRRGGWLAAVPTEALIIGMPWVPRDSLFITLPNFSDDWSLQGRMLRNEDSAMAKWQRRWAAGRAAAYITSVHAPIELIRACDRLGTFTRGFPESYELIAAHSLEIGVSAHAAGDSTTGHRLLLVAWSNGTPWSEPDISITRSPRFVAVVNANTAALVQWLSSDPGQSVEYVLMYGDGRTEVIDALTAHLKTGWLSTRRAVAGLAARHEHVRTHLTQIIADPHDQRRALLGVLLSNAIGPHTTPQFESAMHSLLASDDPDEAIEAIRAIAYRWPQEGARRAIELIPTYPSHAHEIAVALKGYKYTLIEFEPRVVAASSSDDPRVRAACLALLL